MIKTDNEIRAAALCDAMRILAGKPENMDNFQSYLENHFSIFFEKYANTPEGLIYELLSFGEMEV